MEIAPSFTHAPVGLRRLALPAALTNRLSRRDWAWLVAAAGVVAAVLVAVLVVGVAGDNGSVARQGVATRAAARPPVPPPVVEEPRLIEVSPEVARTLNAEMPFAVGPIGAASPFRFAGPADARARALGCLTAAVWYEAGDDAVGQRAVAQVILNRTRNPAFPAGVCGVVFQGSQRGTGCQFTFTCDGAFRRRPSTAGWARATAVASAALDGTVDPTVGLATHYHADYVLPYWASSLDKISRVGPHIFYKWKGYWGTKAAFSTGAGLAPEPAYAALAPLSSAHAVAGALLTYQPPDMPIGTDGVALPAIALPTTPPPAMIVEGVREKSLRGAVVRGDGVTRDQYFLQLDGATFAGNYATAAVALCKDKPVCSVFGWRDIGRMGSELPLTPAQREALTFSFLRTEAGERALWNCAQIERANKTQCLDKTVASASNASASNASASNASASNASASNTRGAGARAGKASVPLSKRTAASGNGGDGGSGRGLASLAQ